LVRLGCNGLIRLAMAIPMTIGSAISIRASLEASVMMTAYRFQTLAS